MANDPWTGAHLGDDMQDAPLGGSYLREAVNELGKWTCPGFASTAARDAAFTAWVAAGNTASDGMSCTVGRTIYIRQGTTWWTSTPQVFATRAARDAAFPSPRAGDQCVCLGTLMTHDGVAWRFILSGGWSGTTDANGFFTIPHGGGQAPIGWTMTLIYQPNTGSGADQNNFYSKILASSNAGDATVLGGRAVWTLYTGVSYYPAGASIAVSWMAQF